jgi:methylase of polypeptide subunit release factors
MSAQGIPQPIEVAAPPSVSRVVQALCAPWMRYKRAVHLPRQSRAVFERVLGRDFVVWPGVLNPVTFRAGRYLAEFIARTSRLKLESGAAGATALDLGTGCGILAVFAALRGYTVTATDVEPGAVSCARANAILNRVEDRVRVLQGDLFAPVAGQSFDLVVFNLPFFRGSARTPLERAWMSPDIIERCATGLSEMLTSNGVAYFVLSSHGDAEGLLAALSRAGLSLERLTWRHFGVETLAIYSARYVLRPAQLTP